MYIADRKGQCLLLTLYLLLLSCVGFVEQTPTHILCTHAFLANKTDSDYSSVFKVSGQLIIVGFQELVLSGTST